MEEDFRHHPSVVLLEWEKLHSISVIEHVFVLNAALNAQQLVWPAPGGFRVSGLGLRGCIGADF